MMINRVALVLILTSTAAKSWAAECSFSMSKERYFENEPASIVPDCSNGKWTFEIVWSSLGKTLRNETVKETVTPDWFHRAYRFRLKGNLRAVTPITARVAVDGPESAHDAREISARLFPSSTDYLDLPSPANKRVAVYDPEKGIEPALKNLSLATIPIANADTLEQLQSDLFIIGPDAMRHDGEQVLRRLEPKVRQGLCVLVLEQSSLPELPFKIFVEPQLVQASSISFRAGILPREIPSPLRWGVGAIAANSVLVTSAQSDPDVWIGLTEDSVELPPEFQTLRLSRSVALKIPYGNGAYCFNQLAISKSFNDEPLALWWLAQLLGKCR